MDWHHIMVKLSPAAVMLAVNIASLVLVALLGIPAVIAIVRSARRRYRTGERYSVEFYQDKDGEATKEAIEKVSRKVYPIFSVILVVVGSSTALVRAVLAVVYKQPFVVETWLQFGLWIFLLAQAAALLTETHYTNRFTLGLMKGWSCVIAIIALGCETFMRWQFGLWDDVQVYLTALQVVMAVAAMLLSFSFQRRPDVFRNGTVVDREKTVSILNRLSFSWAAHFISLASRGKLVELDQLAELDLETRAKSQHDTFTWTESKINLPGMGKPPLWRTLMLSNAPQIISQILVSVPQALLTFAPHLCLLQIVRLLEARGEGAAVATRLVPWIIGLGVSIGLSSLLENWNYWIAHNKISLRVYEQLSAVVFSKAMRLNGAPPKSQGKDKKENKDKNASPFHTQNAVNLVTVDVSRVVLAATYLHNVVLAPLKLAVAFVMLQRLLGWKAMLSGVASLSALTPIHHKFMSKSSAAEKKLMARRGEKITALTEALQGIRHIKFAAMEGKWEAKLNGLRNAELLAQGIASGWKVASLSLWIFTPVSASLASLSVYATTHGNLPPSIAFTAISALASLEVAVSIVPDVFTQGLAAWASLGHISKFLDAPENVSRITPSKDVEFENATIAWVGTAKSKPTGKKKTSENENSPAGSDPQSQDQDEPGSNESPSTDSEDPSSKYASIVLRRLKGYVPKRLRNAFSRATGTENGSSSQPQSQSQPESDRLPSTNRDVTPSTNNNKSSKFNLGLSNPKKYIPQRVLSLIYRVTGGEDEPESQPELDHDSDDSASTRVDDASSKAPFTLRGLNAQFPKHGFSIVSGPTGSGKSLLLASILGESEIVTGSVKAPSPPTEEELYNDSSIANQWILDSAIAYVVQNPWIEMASIRDNIVFGLPFIEGRYEKVIAACALTKDLDMLVDKDQTEIGPNGVNLSSGQKARVSLARALYSRAGVLLIDDIFSTVDFYTARHLYKHALTGDLVSERTRILATRHVRLCLPKLDYLMYLENGKMNSAGLVDHALMDEFLGRDCDAARRSKDEHTGSSLTQSMFDFFHQRVHDVRDHVLGHLVEHTESGPAAALRAGFTAGLRGHSSEEAPITAMEPRKIVEEELGSDSVTWRAFYRYIRTCGGWFLWVPVALAFPAYIGLILGQNWIVNLWSRQAHQVTASGTSEELKFYLGLYGALSTAAWVAGTVGCFFALTASMQASRRLFHHVMPVVLRAPLRWLDSVPLGRILSRLSADFSLLDSRLGIDLAFLMNYAMQVLGVVVSGLMTSPIAILPVLVLGSACLPYIRWYFTTSRALKRLESITRSPVYDLLESCVTGLWTIRVYGRPGAYVDRMQDNIDRHARACWHLWLVNRWVNFRMSIIAALFAITLAIITMIQTNMSASTAGFGLSFVIQLSTAMAMGIKAYGNFELDMNSIERVLEYSEVQTEEYEDGEDAPEGWPSEGRLEVSDLSVHYAPGLPAALHGVSFQAEPKQRIGIVGRTGAGKSSLALSLFRFLEAQAGHIKVDGTDISQIKLSELRSRMAIISQNPMLFAGTVRSNLDPFDEYDDDVLLVALKRAQWIPNDDEDKPQENGQAPANGIEGALNNIQDEANQVSAAADGMFNTFNSLMGNRKREKNPFLDTPVAVDGLNFSQGQRQLLCLAREIVSSPKILVLDEATSATDNAIDAKIRKFLRGEKSASTTLVIAHRVRTVAEFDRILVLDAGKVVEFGSPRELMNIKDGVFRGMVEEDFEREYLEEVIYN